MHKVLLYKINLFNLVYDFRDFIKNNRGKLILIAAINIIAIILGIRGGLSVGNVSAYLFEHRPNTFLFLAGKKGIISYFLINLLTYVAISVILIFSSLHFIIAYLSFIVLFLRSYLFALQLSLYIILLKLSVLPFVLICLVPCFIISSFIFALITVWSINRACEARLYGCEFRGCIIKCLQFAILPCSMFVILNILVAILSYFLTLGIIL